MSNQSPELPSTPGTERLSPEELLRRAAEDREDDRQTSSGGHYPADRLAPPSNPPAPDQSPVIAAGDIGEVLPPLPSEDGLEYARSIIRGYRARISGQSSKKDEIRVDDEHTAEQQPILEPDAPNIKALIDKAKRLAVETRVPHGVKKDIHGKPAVVRHDRK
jgi:hypothetical protein